MSRRSWLIAPLIALAVATAALAQGEFTRLFNGRNLDGFDFVGAPAEGWPITEGVIQCSGKTTGYLVTRTSHSKYVLRFDWKYARPANLQDDASFRGNSGLLIHITGEQKVWPQCVEVQLQNSDAGNIFGLGGSRTQGKKDAEAQKAAIKPVGEWNTMEVTCDGARITCKINGVLVCEATNNDLAGGPIGWQSEGAEIHFRNIELRRIE